MAAVGLGDRDDDVSHVVASSESWFGWRASALSRCARFCSAMINFWGFRGIRKTNYLGSRTGSSEIPTS